MTSWKTEDVHKDTFQNGCTTHVVALKELSLVGSRRIQVAGVGASTQEDVRRQAESEADGLRL